MPTSNIYIYIYIYIYISYENQKLFAGLITNHNMPQSNHYKTIRNVLKSEEYLFAIFKGAIEWKTVFTLA